VIVSTRPSSDANRHDIRVDCRWQLGIGANVTPGGAHFRVWAPKRSRVDVVIERGPGAGASVALARDDAGYFSGHSPDAQAGSLYRYRLDGDLAVPDPCSRFQPDGPHGPSLVVDPDRFRWSDTGWPGITMAGQVIYEVHVGAFTQDGTLDAAAAELPELARLGVTLVELMPVADFPGRFNWGYDGVALYAPSRIYGDADALRRFVDAAHAVGLGVILDVVYNHVGPDGSVLRQLSDEYFTDRYDNEWGDAIDFDGPGSHGTREFFVQNGCYWVSEFHLDGLRLDATQSIHDAGPRHVIGELSMRARAAASPRSIVLIGENEPQDVRCLAPVDRGGFGLDAVWTDDFHHTARVALTGRREAYYTDYLGTPQEFLSALKRGFLYQGQRYRWQEKARGTRVTSEPGRAFVFYLQNHDQVANEIHGRRLDAMAAPEAYRAMVSVLLLGPETPLLFMGQEFGASSPFVFFADHRAELAASVARGRRGFLAQFPSYATPESQEVIPDPDAEETFERSRLDHREREAHAGVLALHHDLLRLRRHDAVVSRQSREEIDGAVLGPTAFVVRYFGGEAGDRLLIVNLGTELEYDPAPEPLLAPVQADGWQLVWSSDDPRYGGPGIVHPCRDGVWRLPAQGAAFLTSSPTPR
jgi:maltooligosyltrehalose trehalohydrolase